MRGLRNVAIDLQSPRRNIPKDLTLQQNHYENQKCRKLPAAAAEALAGATTMMTTKKKKTMLGPASNPVLQNGVSKFSPKMITAVSQNWHEDCDALRICAGDRGRNMGRRSQKTHPQSVGCLSQLPCHMADEMSLNFVRSSLLPCCSLSFSFSLSRANQA